MLAKVVGLFIAKKNEPKLDKFSEKLNLKELKNSNYYRFFKFPWHFWIFGSLLLMIAIYLTYIIYTENIRHYITIGFNVLLYYMYFFIIYAGKIERVKIDKRKGIIKYALINIFFSKKEEVYYLNDIEDIEIVRKGIIARGHDTSKFYIRIVFKDETQLDFGESVRFMTIQGKYRQVVAIIKGLIIPDIISADFVLDEVKDYTN